MEKSQVEQSGLSDLMPAQVPRASHAEAALTRAGCSHCEIIESSEALLRGKGKDPFLLRLELPRRKLTLSILPFNTERLRFYSG